MFKKRAMLYFFLIIQVIIMTGLLLSPFYNYRVLKIPQLNYSVSFFGGAFFVFIGGTIVLKGVFDLGSSFTVFYRPRSNSKLITAGIYKHIRNPIYTGGVLFGIGWGAVWSSLESILLTLSLSVLFFIKVVLEERFLYEMYGDNYLKYKDSSKRFTPWF